MNNVEWYKALLKKKANADLKKVKLLSTSRLDETIAVVLPKKDKNKNRKQYLSGYRQRPQIKKHHRQYVRDWSRRNPEEQNISRQLRHPESPLHFSRQPSATKSL